MSRSRSCLLRIRGANIYLYSIGYLLSFSSKFVLLILSSCTVFMISISHLIFDYSDFVPD